MTAGVFGNRTSQKSVVFTVVFPALYSLLFIGGLVLNSLAAWILFKINNRSSFILYLKNMAAADFLMIFTFPLKAVNETKLEPLKLDVWACKYFAVLFYTSMYVNIIFLGLVSLDRYLKIVRPFGYFCLYSYPVTQVISAGVWVGMIALSLPNIILTNQRPNARNPHNCIAMKSELGIHWHGVISYISIFIFTVVLVNLLVSYVSIYRHVHRSNAQFISSADSRGLQACQNISVVLVVFFVCFVPYHLWRIPFTLSQIDKEFSKESKDLLMYGKKVTLFLSSCNVCLDPIIYFLMCRSFTRRLRAQLGMKRKTTFNKSQVNVQKVYVRRFREHSPTWTRGLVDEDKQASASHT